MSHRHTIAPVNPDPYIYLRATSATGQLAASSSQLAAAASAATAPRPPAAPTANTAGRVTGAGSLFQPLSVAMHAVLVQYQTIDDNDTASSDSTVGSGAAGEAAAAPATPQNQFAGAALQALQTYSASGALITASSTAPGGQIRLVA